MLKYNINNKAFTLIELIIAMSIISLLVVGFFGFYNSTIKYNTKNEKDIKSLNIAQSEIENLRQQIKSGRASNFKTTTNEDITLNGEISSYEVVLDENNNSYNLDIDLDCLNSLYTIKVSVRFGNDYFSKKSTELITQVFGG